jgi:IS30 family transposase
MSARAAPWRAEAHQIGLGRSTVYREVRRAGTRNL